VQGSPSDSLADQAHSSALVLAIDQGTSATKAVLVDTRGQIVSRASVSLAQQHPQPGWAEQDAMEIWGSVQHAVRDCLEAVDPSAVAAVGLSTQRESTLLWDRTTGEPLGPVLGWQDTRGAGLCANLRAAGHADRIRSITGLPLDAMFSAAALLDRFDANRSRSRRSELCLGTVDSWLLWQLSGRLGGQHTIETGNAARTQLLDITTRKWDPWLLDSFNIPIEAQQRHRPVAGTGCRRTTGGRRNQCARDLHANSQAVDAVVAAARETKGIVTAEEATIAGGLGGAVAETVVQNHPVRMKILGVPEFAPTGSAGFLLDRYGMSPEGIADAARALNS
jgi:glycerol kinase